MSTPESRIPPLPRRPSDNALAPPPLPPPPIPLPLNASIGPASESMFMNTLNALAPGVYDTVRELQRTFRVPEAQPNPFRAAYEFSGLGPVIRGEEPSFALAEGPVMATARPIMRAGREAVEQTSNALRGARKSNPFADLPEPPRSYHGTTRAFETYDLTKADPKGQYGPGIYHTEDAATAGGRGSLEDTFGYAMTGSPQDLRQMRRARELETEITELEKTLRKGDLREDQVPMFRKWLEDNKRDLQYVNEELGASKVAPNVRPARVAIRNPFDIDAVFDEDEAADILDKISKTAPDYDWDYAFEQIERLSEYENPSGEALYRIMEKITDEATGKPMGRAKLNELLKAAGYDGITHIGGGNTKNKAHRVWIAFDREQIRSPWGDWSGAEQFGAAAGATLLGANAFRRRSEHD